MKIAVISDIHGNSWALREVLKDIERRGPNVILNLGDSLYGPLRPGETYEMIQSTGIVSISGNEDRLIVENIDNKNAGRNLGHVINELPGEAIHWLQSLPCTRTMDWGAFLCHGTPHSDETYLLERVNDSAVERRDVPAVEELLQGIPQRLICCGHSHLPGILRTPGRVIVNPGSVGLNAYDDDHPSFHKIENHHNKAQYCMVEIDGESIRIEPVSLTYDVRKAAACAAAHGRDDWAAWLLTGCAGNRG